MLIIQINVEKALAFIILVNLKNRWFKLRYIYDSLYESIQSGMD